MVNILLVEDEANKRAALADAILSSGVEEKCLDIATDVSAAKRMLQARGYDLLLLDIHLPKKPNMPPDPAGGLEVLRWLKGRGKEHCPQYIVGTTVHGSSFDLAQTEFDNFVWTIIAFSFTDNSWKPKLASTLSLICGQLVPPYASDGVTYRTDVLILTALESPELSEVLALPLIWEQVPVRFDTSRYFKAEMLDGERTLSIIAVAASDKGMASAAAATTKAIQAFQPKLVAMTGICAGVKSRVKLGDVVVADPSYDWGAGKERVGKSGKEYFQPAPYQRRLDESLRIKAVELDGDVKFKAAMFHRFAGKKGVKPPKIHVAAFASGAAVLQAKSAVDKLVAHHKDLKGIDMEVYSVLNACEISNLPRPNSIAIKGVCDFGDSKKHDGYQRYAAYVSARCLFELIPKLV